MTGSAAIDPRVIGEFFAYIRAARHWSRRHPELAEEPDIRSLLAAYPEDWNVTKEGVAEACERRMRVFDTTLSAITDFAYILDRDGRFIYANKALLDLWGLPLEAAVGKNFFDLQYPEDLAGKLQTQIRQVFESGRRVADETLYTSPKGEAGYYEYIFCPVLGVDGTVEAVAGSTRDITERKRHELHLAFLAETQKLLAPLSSSGEIMQRASEHIARRLRLSHCLFVEINEAADEATVLYDHHAPGAADLVGVYRIADFHTESERQEMVAGRVVAIDDVRSDVRSQANAARFAELGIGALANASYVADGRWKFVLSAQKTEPYAWRPEDVELLSELAARIYLRLERAHAEENLRESEERFRSTFENAAIGIAHVGLDGRWLWANQALCDLTGYPPEELARTTFADITHPDDLEASIEAMHRLLAGEISSYAVEKRYIRKDGKEVWANLTASMLRDSAGQPLRFISAIEDITEKRKAMAELDRQRRFVERLTHVMPSVLYVMDLADQRTVWVNRQLGLSIGYSLEEMQAMGAQFTRQMMHPDDLARLPAHAAGLATLGDGETLEIEYRFRHRNGEWRWFRSCDTPFARDAEGRVREIIGTATDVTERRRIEEALNAAKEAAENANSSKDRFLAVLSHELRTPLTPVLMTAAALRGDESLPVEVREQLGMIERNVSLEARLIDDLLDLTRIVNGKLIVRAEPCDAHSLLGLVIEMVRGDAQEKQVALHLELSARRNHLTGDPARLQQVFWNLLRNAVKFTPTGGRVLVRSFDGADAAGTSEGAPFCVEVSDNGVGFDPDSAVRIFEPFEQGGSGHQFGGLGLGLAIARAIVDMHAGVIRAVSPGPGQGAIFTVELPGATVPHPVVQASSSPGRTGANGVSSNDVQMRLLVVEDHDPTLLVITRLLTRAGYRITMARNLAEARAAAAVETFDVVVSDLGLPDGTGIELMKELRASRGLRGIALSGYGTDADVRRSLEAGFVTHLVKPVDINELRRALQNLASSEAGEIS